MVLFFFFFFSGTGNESLCICAISAFVRQEDYMIKINIVLIFLAGYYSIVWCNERILISYEKRSNVEFLYAYKFKSIV